MYYLTSFTSFFIGEPLLSYLCIFLRSMLICYLAFAVAILLHRFFPVERQKTYVNSRSVSQARGECEDYIESLDFNADVLQGRPSIDDMDEKAARSDEKTIS